MYGMLILLGFVAWLAIAFAPLVLLFAKHRWFLGGFIGLPFMLAVLAAPFWDYFFMVPAVSDAYKRYAVSKVYKTSHARTIQVIKTENGVITPTGAYYEDALWQGRVDFIEAYQKVRRAADSSYNLQLVRYSLQPKDSPLCENTKHQMVSGFAGMRRHKYCLTYEIATKESAEVVLQMGTVRVIPNSNFPNKMYSYSYYRTKVRESGEILSERVGNFIWDPDVCYFFNACRYVFDRNGPTVGYPEDALVNLRTAHSN